MTHRICRLAVLCILSVGSLMAAHAMDPDPLPPARVGAPYAATLSATGGTGTGYTYSVAAPYGFTYKTATAWDAGGTLLAGTAGVDDNYWNVALPFTFRLNGTPFTSVYVGSNGLMGFDAGSSAYSNTDLPIGSPQYLLAPFWKDLVVRGIYVRSSATEVLIRWDAYLATAPGMDIEFEVFLWSNNGCEFRYKQTDTTGQGLPTIGMQAGASVWSLSSTVAPGMCYRNAFDPTLPPGLTLTGASITGMPTTVGTYPVHFGITDSGSNYTAIDRDLVVGINAAPVIAQSSLLSVTMSEDGSPTAFTAALTASDSDGDTITWSRVGSPPGHGSATVSGTGASPTISYTPAADYVGNDSFIVQASDGCGGNATCTVNVTIQAVNDPPVNTVLPVVTGTLEVRQALSVTTGTWNDDHDGNPAPTVFGYQWQRATAADGTGAANISGATSMTYVLQAADLGCWIRCRVTATDGGTPHLEQASASSLWQGAITGNAVPVIAQSSPLSVTMSEDGSPTAFTVTLTASDADGDTIVWTSAANPTHGSATVSGTGASPTISYTPDPDYVGSDSFIVQASDGNGGNATCTVNVAIQAVNDPPVNTVLPVVTGPLQMQRTLSVTTGTWNDDHDGNPAPTAFVYQWQRATAADGTGAIDISGATSMVYVLQAADLGRWLRCRVTTTDSGTPHREQASASSLWQGPIIANASPVIAQSSPLAVTMSEDASPTAFAATLTASDADGDDITWTCIADPDHGTATVSGTGATPTISYAPDADYHGSDALTVQADDGRGGTATCVIAITIAAVNDPPVNRSAPTVSGILSQAHAVTAGEGIWDDDADGNPAPVVFGFQWQRATAANGSGAVDIAGANAATYVLSVDDVGAWIGCRVTATDAGSPATAETSASSLWYGPVLANAVPVFAQLSPLPVTMSEDGSPTAFSATLSATDADGDTITWSCTVAPSHGVATVTGTGSSPAITYVPTADWNGSDSFTVQAGDGHGGTAIRVVEVTVAAVNDLPVCTSQPTVSGNLGGFDLLTATSGVWQDDRDGGPAPTLFAFRWQRAASADGSGTTDIVGAVGATYTPTADDVGGFIRCVVQATDAGSPGTATAEAATSWIGLQPAQPDAPVSGTSTASNGNSGNCGAGAGLGALLGFLAMGIGLRRRRR